jgi:hypothetical protein
MRKIDAMGLLMDDVRRLLTEASELWLAERLVDGRLKPEDTPLFATLELGELGDSAGYKFRVEPDWDKVREAVRDLIEGNYIGIHKEGKSG